MEYRVENKYLVTDADLAVLAGRLKPVMQEDAHQKNGSYEIRSLYFDDLKDRCMDENDAGVDQREKYRIRIYDGSTNVIHLEIKEKRAGLTKKTACDLSAEECRRIMENRMDLCMDSRKPLNKLKLQMYCAQMKPKLVVAYERTAFVHPVGNVRVTFDRCIMGSKNVSAFFEDKVDGMVPILPAGIHVLEVKYDEFLPDFIAKKLELGKLRQTAFSKYYLGRLAVQGDLF